MSDLMLAVQHLDSVQQIASESRGTNVIRNSEKSDVAIPKEFALALLDKLANDDAYRSAYESNPAQALAAIGVPADIVNALPNTKATKLAEKSVLAEALVLLRKDAAEVCYCQRPPNIKLGLDRAAPSATESVSLPIAAA